jgi:4-hydroxy-tetrahydrodipicolinate synthase
VSLNLDGLIPATVLPMSDGGVIDEAALRRYIRWIAPQGPVALAINADTGEGPHLTHQEKCRVIEVVAEETDLPIVAGVAGPFQAQAVQQARDYQAAGASALLVFPISAYLSQPLDPRIPVEYHKAIAEVGLPLVAFQLQPMLGGVNFDSETLRQLIEVDGVVAMKEASFDARRYLDTFRIVEQTAKYQAGEFTYLTGNDNFILESFMLGCTGALIGFGAIMTREQVAMIEAWNAGRLDEAKALGKRVQRLADVLFDAPVANYRVRTKEALHALGVPGLEDTTVRPPLLPIDDAEKRFLAEVLAEVGLLEGANV